MQSDNRLALLPVPPAAVNRSVGDNSESGTNKSHLIKQSDTSNYRQSLKFAPVQFCRHLGQHAAKLKSSPPLPTGLNNDVKTK